MALRRNSAATSRVDLPFHSGRSFQIPKAELRRAATRAAGVRIVRRICAMVGIGSVAAGPALAFLRLDDFAARTSDPAAFAGFRRATRSAAEDGRAS